MKKIKKYVLCSTLSLCCLFICFNMLVIKAYSISKGNFKSLDSNEQIVKHTSIGYWNNGGFFETVTRQQIGNDTKTGYSKWRFRYYVTHRGDNGSYIYQKVPVGLVIDGTRKATFDKRKSGNVRNTTKLWGEYTMSLSPGQHKVQLADISGGAITVVNATATINVPIPKYTVKFVDYDGKLLKTQVVDLNKNATPPPNPSLTGHAFIGWNGNYKNVKQDEIVTAQYDIKKFSVNFIDWNNNILKSETVNYGDNATPPSNPSRTGFTFTGWNGTYTGVTSNRTITAKYEINTCLIDFNTMGGTPAHFSKYVTYGDTVQKPVDPMRSTDKFMGWFTDPNNRNTAFNFETKITKDVALYAQWDSIPVLKADEITIFENLYNEEEWKEKRMENVSANDKEDGNITSKIEVKKDTVKLTEKGQYIIIYVVRDSVGNIAEKKVNVKVLDKRAKEDSTYKYIRSISSTYKDTLHPNSKWNIDDALKNLLNTMWRSDNTQKSAWILSVKDIENIQKFNTRYGYSKADNIAFMSQFAHLEKNK